MNATVHTVGYRPDGLPGFDLKVRGERADHEAGVAFVLLPAVAFVSQYLKTYVESPPRQKPGSFNLDQVLQKLQEGGAGKR